jgi:hypothetical protein
MDKTLGAPASRRLLRGRAPSRTTPGSSTAWDRTAGELSAGEPPETSRIGGGESISLPNSFGGAPGLFIAAAGRVRIKKGEARLIQRTVQDRRGSSRFACRTAQRPRAWTELPCRTVRQRPERSRRARRTVREPRVKPRLPSWTLQGRDGGMPIALPTDRQAEGIAAGSS